MIQLVEKDENTTRTYVQQLKQRCDEKDRKVDAIVADILENVRNNGDKAVAEYTLKFDGSIPEQVEITKEQMKELTKQCDAYFLEALERAAKNIHEFHSRQKQQSWLDTKDNGVILGQRVRGLAKVGIYVPGGTAAYPSSVLMNAIPAKIAGVQEIVMVTPPGKDGKPNPDIMAAALVAGVDRVFLVGGAQAVAALAYGTETMPKVDKIVGPGNIFVATAKKHLYGTVDIDMIAGPSEILIVADETANPKYLAADLMSQAEHDVLASAILLTTSSKIAEETIAQIYEQVSTNHWMTSAQSLYAIPWTKPLNLQMIWLPNTWRFALQIRWNISAVWTMPVLCSLEIILPNRLEIIMQVQITFCQPAEPQDFSRRCPLTALLKNPASFITHKTP